MVFKARGSAPPGLTPHGWQRLVQCLQCLGVLWGGALEPDGACVSNSFTDTSFSSGMKSQGSWDSNCMLKLVGELLCTF